MHRVVATLLLAVVTASSCTRDLEVPAPPERGNVSGALVDTAGAPLGAFPVVVEPESGASDGGVVTSQTDTDGAFLVVGLAPGRYVARFAGDGFIEVQRYFTVVSRQTRDLGTLTLQRLAVPGENDGFASGTVTVDTGASPLGAQVTFLKPDTLQQVGVLTVGASGEYVQRLPPGDYRVVASHPLYVASAPIDFTLDAKEQEALSPLQLLINPGTVTGDVRRELDLSNATVAAAGALVSADTLVSAPVNASGGFQLGGLAPGVRTLRFTLPGHAAVERTVEVRPAQTSALDAGVVLPLERGTVAGEVEMGDNTPLQDVTVSLNLAATDGGTSPYAAQASPAGTRGSYVIRGVPVGSYTVRASRNNYITANSGQVTVTANGVVAPDVLRLFRIQGDFEIDDGDATNAPGFTRTAALRLRLTSANNPTEYRVSESSAALATLPFTAFGPNDAGLDVTPTNIPFSLASGDGTHTVFIQYRDGQGNLSGVLNGSVVLDTVRPEPDAVAALVLESGVDFTRQSVRLSAEVRGSDPRGAGVDNVSGVGFVRLSASNTLDAQGRLSGPLQVYGVGLQFDRPVTADGPQRVYAQFVDNAGNHSSALGEDQVVVDTVAPSGTMSITRGALASADGFTNDPDVELVFDVAVEPNGGSVLVKLANDAVGNLASAPLFSVQPSMAWSLTPTEGARAVHYRLVDAAGNEATNGVQAITFDRTPPVGALTLTSPALTNNLALQLALSATDGNGLSTTAALALSEESTFSSAATQRFATLPATAGFTLSAGEGLRTLYARFADVAGNTSTAVATVRIDQTAPSGAIALLGTLADNTRSEVLTAVAAVDVQLTPGEATEYLLGDANLVTCPATGYLALPATNVVTSHPLAAGNGAREVRACLRDAAGNTSRVQDGITLDTAAPAGCSLTLDGRRADGASSGPTKTANRAITVAATCPDATEIFLTDGALTCAVASVNDYQPFRSPLPFTLSGGDGASTVRACVRDAARNVATATPAVITLDTQPPSGSLVINGNAPWLNAAQVTAGRATLTITGVASGATDWAVSTSPLPSSFVAMDGGAQVLANTPVSDGLLTVYGAFQDDVGNRTQATITDTIVVDATPPTVAGLSLAVRSTGQPGYTNSEAVTVSTVFGSRTTGIDALEAFLVERTASGACTPADFVSAQQEAVANSWTFLLSPLEGPRRVCVRYRDAAGNHSIGGTNDAGLLESGIVLDKTPPSTPQIVTPDSFEQLPDFAPFVVSTSGPSIDNVSVAYQRLGGFEEDGGRISTWSFVTPSGSLAPRFTYRVHNDGSRKGIRNELKLRAIDPAGNTSGESVVFITADTSPPGAVEVSPSWVDNGDGRATVYFKRNGALADGVAGMHVYYSSNPDFRDVDTATFANEGPSPLTIPSQTSASLSGLPNGVPTYVRIRPFDEAGNEAGDGGTTWVSVDGGALAPLRLQPDVISTNELGVMPLPAVQDKVHRLAMHDAVLYVLTSSSFCSTNFTYALHAVNLRGLDSPIQNGRIRENLLGPGIASTLSLPQAAAPQLPCSDGASDGDIVLEGNWAFVSIPSRVFIVDVSEPLAPTLYTTIDVTGIDPGANFRLEGLRAYGNRLALGGQKGSAGNGTFAAVWNLSELYDRNSGTAPDGGDRLSSVVTSTQAPSAVAFTRDHMVAFGRVDTTYRFDLAPGFGAPAAPLVYDGLTALQAQPTSRPPVSGNLLYASNDQFGLQALQLGQVWTGADPGWPSLQSWFSSAFTGFEQADVQGHLAFLPDEAAKGVRVLDLSSRVSVRSAGINTVTSGPAPSHVVTYGNYVIAATGQSLRFYEVATPRALRSVGAVQGSGYYPKVMGSFLFTGGRVFDLQNGAQPAQPDDSLGTCWNGAAYGEDLEVNGRGDGFVVRSVEPATDRLSSTDYALGTSTTVTLTGARVTDVEVWGNYIVVAEVRPTGYFLEVFDARDARNRGAAVMTAADSVGSVQVAALATTTSAMLDLSLSGGRAAVGVELNDGTLGTPAVGNNLYFVELKNLFDDSNLTTGGTVHGPVQVPQVRQVVMQGNHAYAATFDGLRIIDITTVMDGTPGASSPPVISSALVGNYLEGVFVAGTMLLTSPGFGNGQDHPQGVYAFDVSLPATPEIQAFSPRQGDNATCLAPGDTVARRVHQRITAAGNRAYLNTGSGALQVLELE